MREREWMSYENITLVHYSYTGFDQYLGAGTLRRAQALGLEPRAQRDAREHSHARMGLQHAGRIMQRGLILV